jgi:thiamine-phosphate pyrophosphorylase
LIIALCGGQSIVLVDFKLYLITDRRQTLDRDLRTVVEQALRGGVRAVQVREKDLPEKALRPLATELRAITSRYRAKLLINGNVNIAREVHADGVHLPESGPSVEAAREVLGPASLIGSSCHSLESARLAQERGADFITFGPVFFTPSKEAYGRAVGLELLSRASEMLRIPVFGVGGIRAGNVPQVLATGAHGIALISAILSAEQPEAAAALLVKLYGA